MFRNALQLMLWHLSLRREDEKQKQKCMYEEIFMCQVRDHATGIRIILHFLWYATPVMKAMFYVKLQTKLQAQLACVGTYTGNALRIRMLSALINKHMCRKNAFSECNTSSSTISISLREELSNAVCHSPQATNHILFLLKTLFIRTQFQWATLWRKCLHKNPKNMKRTKLVWPPLVPSTLPSP